MFRRRTTDQVYATLQQVQRRITEGGAPAPGQPAAPGPKPPPARFPSPLPVPAAGAPAQPGTASYHNTPQPGTASYHSTPAPQPGTASISHAGSPPAPVPLQAPPPSGRFLLQIPVGLASTLALVWLLSLATAFLLGQRSGRGGAGDVPPPPPTSDNTANVRPVEAPVARRQGDHVLLLKSVPSFTPDLRGRWQAEADRLNAYMRQNEAKGWKPYFALREPSSGHLEFVFGKADGQFGIDRAAFEDFAKLMAVPPPKGGGYTSAKWVKAE